MVYGLPAGRGPYRPRTVDHIQKKIAWRRTQPYLGRRTSIVAEASGRACGGIGQGLPVGGGNASGVGNSGRGDSTRFLAILA